MADKDFQRIKKKTMAERADDCRGEKQCQCLERQPECRKTVEFPPGKESSEGFLHGKIKVKKGIL
ncbi:MAG: hypothetical protein SOT18_06695 [Eubacterium sp.]|nr:hypothetical protein [Eubacterium sp.]